MRRRLIVGTRKYVGTRRRNHEQTRVRRLALFVPPRLATPASMKMASVLTAKDFSFNLQPMG